MTQTEFNLIFENQVSLCAKTLINKSKEYTGNSPDRLSAFKTAAALQECTPKRALAGMMAKHIVSIYDMCYSDDKTFPSNIWDEKITDCIDYLFLLKAVVKEEQENEQN